MTEHAFRSKRVMRRNRLCSAAIYFYFTTLLISGTAALLQQQQQQSIYETASIMRRRSVPYRSRMGTSLAQSAASSSVLDNDFDRTGCTARQFSLGYDISLTRFAGSMGFDEVIDWDYFTNPYDAADELDRDIVEPPPFDPTKPKRTKSSSGSVVRLFLGEFQGALASKLRAQGMDSRVLVKEFVGEAAQEIAKNEFKSIARMQSMLVEDMEITDALNGEWAANGAGRYLQGKTEGSTREDDASVVSFYKLLAQKKAPFVGIIGALNLAEYDEDDMIDPNEWYRFLGVKPPVPGSIWIVYEYAGLNTINGYLEPATIRRAKIPMSKGIFGMPVAPPSLPVWSERANYVVKGIMKGSLEALAYIHDKGIAHRSLGRSSILISSVGMDKAEAFSPYTTIISRLLMKFSDFGFSGDIFESSNDESFCSRARGFGIDVRPGQSSVAASNFAFAEDLHALGFVFLALLLSSLAEVPSPEYRLPPLDEDSLQRLLGEIFKKNFDEFQEYCREEESWDRVVELLDKDDGAGWQLLQSMCFARERASELQGSFQLVTAQALLANPIFN